MLVAITGGIGCGKSVVSRLLRTMGYEVYDCDSRAKSLMLTDETLRAGLISLFGPETYGEDGSLNKKHLSSAIFSHPEMLEKLNGLIHPAVARDLMKGLTENTTEKRPGFFESAILYESGFDRRVYPDFVISVSSPLELRISRTMARDNAAREKVAERIASQMPQEEKDSRADFVILNDNRHSVIAQVEAAVKKLKNGGLDFELLKKKSNFAP